MQKNCKYFGKKFETKKAITIKCTVVNHVL